MHKPWDCFHQTCVLPAAQQPDNMRRAARRDLFARCLKQPGMVELACVEVGGSAMRASALAFLAAIARDHGGVPQCLQLFRCVWTGVILTMPL